MRKSKRMSLYGMMLCFGRRTSKNAKKAAHYYKIILAKDEPDTFCFCTLTLDIGMIKSTLYQ